MNMEDLFFPSPKSIKWLGEEYLLSPNAILSVPCGDTSWDVFHDNAQAILHDLGGYPLRLERVFGGQPQVTISPSANLCSEGFQLSITRQTGICIQAADAKAAFYAVLTLARILHFRGRALPCVIVTDMPDLPTRGFVLDISRCKVPTMTTLRTLVRQLAMLRINQLQLYTEHTYAFAGHSLVWEKASPMTPNELRELDGFCQAHAIDLVPNLQSFGHMERWLCHAPYRHLAECPDGFFHELLGAHRAAGTLRPSPESLAFVASLYDAYLPNFSSQQFNIGGDEPWELGQGWSQALCATRGRRRVYLTHLSGLGKLVSERGRRMQFWADVLLEETANATMIPENAVPVIWGYDAGHPFEAQCTILARTGREYLVAPGTSSWQSFHGRLDNALQNIREAVTAARTHGARGVLITAWGDNGNHQPWWTFYPALIAGAALAWGLENNLPIANSDETAPLAQAIASVFLSDNTSAAHHILLRAKADRAFAQQIRNKSILWELLFISPEKAAALLSGIDGQEIARARRMADEAWEAQAGGGWESLFTQESSAAYALEKLALQRAKVFLDGGNCASLLPEARAAIELYQAAWLARARPGGLDESTDRITAAFVRKT